jgi:peptidoglycan/xylan/chitin deacetylase (PgdA/CDA1 family)
LRSLTLLYHELRQEKSSYSYVLDCGRFEQHVQLFARLRSAGARGLWPEITFDDGHMSNYEYALPILDRDGLTARFFITVGWTGQRAGYMGWTELRALHAAGQQIGAHGWTHTLLTHSTDSQLEHELAGAKKALEDGLGAAVTSLSLPGGRSNRRVLAACRAAGYEHIYTSVPRAEPMPGGELVGRLNIRGDASADWMEALLRDEGGTLARLGRQHRIKETAKAVLGDRLYAWVWAMANRQETHEVPGTWNKSGPEDVP